MRTLHRRATIIALAISLVGSCMASAEPAPDLYPRTNIFEPEGESGSFNPFGFTGRLMGVPTRAERAGAINGHAMREVAQRISRGMEPNAAFVDFIRSEAGQKWMSSGVADMRTLRAFVDSVTPKPGR